MSALAVASKACITRCCYCLRTSHFWVSFGAACGGKKHCRSLNGRCCLSGPHAAHVVQPTRCSDMCSTTAGLIVKSDFPKKCFYVDNCLQSLQSAREATQLSDNLRGLLVSGGFEISQWPNNWPEVINHLPEDARPDKLELWLAHDKSEAQESTLGVSW